MEVVVMRHGERDYQPCHERGFIGQSIDMMEKRLLGVLNKYMDYDKILIVTHGMLMHQIKPYGHIPNCFVDSFIYDEHFKCAGFHKK